MTHYYCSTISRDYAYKGLALYYSLLRWDKDFHFFILCLHDEVVNLFEQMNLANATIISVSAVENDDPELHAVKKIRNEQEYAWTSKASVMLYIFRHYSFADHIVWLDGDTFFFSSPDPIYDEWGKSSIMLNIGRWDKAHKYFEKRYGRFNTGLMGFKRNRHAIKCLEWLRRRLLKWCYAKRDKDLWSDQVYVNDWPQRFNSVCVVRNIGINVTPPVVVDNKVTFDDRYVYINDTKLVFFHFSQFKYFDGNEFELCAFVNRFSDQVVKLIYLPYILECRRVVEQICIIDPNLCITKCKSEQFIRNYFHLSANLKNDKDKNICTLFTKDYLIQGLALYHSLVKNASHFHLWILCVDETAAAVLEKLNLSQVTIIRLENIKNRTLAKVQETRQLHEFCWTLKSSFLDFLTKNNFNLQSVIYVDADLFFYRDISHIYREWGGHSIFLTNLRLTPKLESKLGKYSAGLIGFKRDRTGRRCLQLWKQKCLKWCYDKHENGLWADQKYLNDWPKDFSGVKVSNNQGINFGSWNIRKDFISEKKNDAIYIGMDMLVCFHFSGFKIINENKFLLCRWNERVVFAEDIYILYLNEIKTIIAQLKSLNLLTFSV